MIKTIFAEGQGDFCEPEAWAGLHQPRSQPLLPGDKTRRVYVGLDLATSAKGDDCALVGVYPDNGWSS